MMRTRQELFNLAWNGLKAQGFERSENQGVCAYRGDNGRKCAIGHCIPDDLYHPRFEGFLPPDEYVEAGELREAAGIGEREIQFARELQEAHDQNPAPDAMEEALIYFAHKHGLEVPQ